VAKEANIYIGKVLSNDGSGSDSGILAGMEWAITNNCKVISMSLGAAVEPGETYSNIYNDIAKKALAKGTLIIAAAGNESRRDLGIINPVGHPANCPAIMAVAALDKNLNVAYFSCGGINSDGGQVDVAAPGVDIYSSWVSPENYNIISGTSMATPCVAGIAALFCEAFPKASASDIWMYLTQHALRLNQNASDVGAGLVQPLK
jgi:subtilisin family serine protease